jgi:hypothetical protein
VADPGTLALVAAATAIVGTGLQSFQVYQQAGAEADAAETNALLAQQQARLARLQSTVLQEQQQRRARALAGQQRAAIGESGLLATGSTLELLSQSAAEAELDRLTLAYEGDLRASGLLAQSSLDAARAGAIRGGRGLGLLGGALGAGAQALRGYSTYRAYGGSGGDLGGYSTWERYGRPLRGAGGRLTGPV